MPGNARKEDLRIQRTKKVALAAICKMLTRKNFNQITVNDLCEEAMISRTAFYSHFNDKYDLLDHWLKDVQTRIEDKMGTYAEAEDFINSFVISNKTVIKNLIENADRETSALFCDFLLSLLRIGDSQENQNDLIISNFCCGGMLKYLLWQVENKFPEDLQTMNPCIYEIFRRFQKPD